MSPKNLHDFIGKEVTLKELPSAFKSDDTQIKVGNKYLVIGFLDSCFTIMLPDGSIEFLHYQRFEESSKF